MHIVSCVLLSHSTIAVGPDIEGGPLHKLQRGCIDFIAVVLSVSVEGDHSTELVRSMTEEEGDGSSGREKEENAALLTSTFPRLSAYILDAAFNEDEGIVEYAEA